VSEREEFGLNSNFPSGDVGGVVMGLLRTSKIIKSLGYGFSRDSYKCHGFLNILPVYEEMVSGIQKRWF